MNRVSIPRTLRTVACAAALAMAGIAAIAQPVGRANEHFTDPARRDWTDTAPRPLAATIWYPAAAGSTAADWTVGIFRAGRSAKDAAIAPSPRRLPLVVVSHGSGGSAAGMAWLAEALAARGYVVAAVDHHGNTAAEPDLRLEGFVVWWDRARDVSVLIDRLLADPRFGPRIDPARIGVAGFSIGGYTALATVGARLSRAQFQAFCDRQPASALCVPPPEAGAGTGAADLRRLLDTNARIKAALDHMDDDFADKRIAAAFAIAPVPGPAMRTDSLERIDVPVRLVVGTADDKAEPALNAELFARRIPGSRLTELPGVTHYAFLPECTATGRQVAAVFCVDPPGVDRGAVHTLVAQDAVAFFGQALGPRRRR